MSLATRTDANLLSSLFGSLNFSSLNFGSKKRPAAAVAVPYQSVQEPAYFFEAESAINKIARRVVGEVVRHRRKMQRARQLVASSDERSISDGKVEISRVLWNMRQRDDDIVDLAAAGRLANRAIWSLFCLSAKPRADT